MKLIVVEGIPGSGKSTTARFIAVQSERNGHATELYHESAYQHPLIMQENMDSPLAWMERYKSNWDRFLEAQTSSRATLVMESVLLQAPILHLLHMAADRDTILTFIESLYERLKDFDFHFVYLYQDEPRVGIERTMTARGGAHGLKATFDKYRQEPYYVNRGLTDPESHLGFLMEYAAIAGVAASRLSATSLTIENTRWDWCLYYQTIVNHFGWSFVPDPIVPELQLMKYVGEYRNEGVSQPILVGVRDGRLFGFGGRPFKPWDANTFYLDSVSMKISFIMDSTGKCCKMVVTEKDVFGNRSDEGTTFLKIT
ncbi:DUF3471 domain-containing protein [Paenibacillus sp. TRM 82003]|nr:DUF3471 domain-containing protein [Paenibacillus sp. TRM 82003]